VHLAILQKEAFEMCGIIKSRCPVVFNQAPTLFVVYLTFGKAEKFFIP